MITEIHCCNEYIEEIKEKIEQENNIKLNENDMNTLKYLGIPIVRSNTVFPFETTSKKGIKIKVYGLIFDNSEKTKLIWRKI